MRQGDGGSNVLSQEIVRGLIGGCDRAIEKVDDRQKER